MIVSFEGQTVVVSGGANGMGRAITLAFASRGAAVWTCDVLEPELAETAKLAKGTAGTVTARIVDVTDPDAVHGFVSAAEMAARTGAVDVMVHNAGGVAGQVGRPLEEVPLEDWRTLFAVNVEAAFVFAQAAAPGMRRVGGGRIVHISSGAGLGVSLTGIQAYASAKAAQIGLTRQLAHELGPWGITVNNVAPGFVRSNPSTERQWQSYGAEGQRALVDRIALRRLGTPDDIANAVVFFASPYASWITGQVLPVDGGK